MVIGESLFGSWRMGCFCPVAKLILSFLTILSLSSEFESINISRKSSSMTPLSLELISETFPNTNIQSTPPAPQITAILTVTV